MPTEKARRMPLNTALLRDTCRVLLRPTSCFPAVLSDQLFQRYPELRDLFANTEMAIQHVRFAALVLWVFDRDDPEHDPAVLVTLYALGQQHSASHVHAVHYAMLGDALQGTLEQVLGAAWTPELLAAWAEAYIFLLQVMLTWAPPDAAVVPARDLNG